MTKKKPYFYEDDGEERVVEEYQPESREVEVPMVKTYTCSDGTVYDNKQKADAHEIELKNTVYVQSVTYYKTSDGKEFPTKAEAEAHEKKLHDPESRITQLENRILELESEVAVLKAKVSLLEDRNKFFPQQPIIKYPSQPLPAEPGQVIYDTKPKQTDWIPFQKPEMIYFSEKHPDCAPIQDGHADVGPSYTAYNPVELDKLSDEELHKMGYTVAYAGHKRAIIPGKIDDPDYGVINKK